MATAIVTGASRGIGRYAAIEISKLPNLDHLVLVATDEERINETKQLIDSQVNVIVKKFDLQNITGIRKLVEEIYIECGSIDYLLNIAGYTEPQSILELDIEILKKTYEINVFSLLELTKCCAIYMRRNKISKILNVASTAGNSPRPGWLAYASSKAAVISISETLSQELAEYNILVYCVSPGRTATDLRKKLAPEEDPSSIMQPQEVASIIFNLMRDTELCLDGQNIRVRRQIIKR